MIDWKRMLYSLPMAGLLILGAGCQTECNQLLAMCSCLEAEEALTVEEYATFCEDPFDDNGGSPTVGQCLTPLNQLRNDYSDTVCGGL